MEEPTVVSTRSNNISQRIQSSQDIPSKGLTHITLKTIETTIEAMLAANELRRD